MKQAYLPRFEELFLGLTGIKAADAEKGNDGWLFMPPQIKTGEKAKFLLDTIKVLGWRERTPGDTSSGWWVKPWPNIKAGKFVALTLSEEGVKGFAFLRDGKPGQRQAYYIDHINTGAISGGPMLLGQFLFELEARPEAVLRMNSGGSNRIYYPRDKRISAYDALTDAEARDAKRRLHQLTYLLPAELVTKLEELAGTVG